MITINRLNIFVDESGDFGFVNGSSDLYATTNPKVERRIEFDHTKKRLFQVSDMLTVIDKLDYKRKNNIPFTNAEKYFFNSKDFRHIVNLLKNKRI